MKNESYKLFIGFRKLGEFPSIWKAKQFARECGEVGVFSLLGTNYSDTWYISKSEVGEQLK